MVEGTYQSEGQTDSINCRKGLADILTSPSLHIGSAYYIAGLFSNTFCLGLSCQISSGLINSSFCHTFFSKTFQIL